MNPASAFELIKWQHIKETKTQARYYRHKKTGAEMLSMINKDENKVFGITFRTPPHDSTGVAHILEHSVLCGSRKYPVKEPFVELLKGSLQTFLNAFTYPDKTCYPVASQNLQDFYNLIDVYMDAVFYPRLTRHVYHQEGWHYEIDSPEGALSRRGVVYNEMKGVYSSPSSLLASLSARSLFPDTTYGLDSGGDPDHIPELTFEALSDFHKKYYHPSNARIFFYGDDNPDERLNIINEYLKKFEISEIESGVGLQTRFATPAAIEKSFPAGGEEGKEPKGMVTVSWLLPETIDPEMNFAMHILEYILIGMPASPLRKALIDSGYGEGLAGTGLESELRQMYFSAGLKGIDTANVKKIEDLIMDTLRSLARDKIDPVTVEAALNTIEFNLREQNTGGFPRGLSQMLLSLTTWLYGADPLALLAFENPLQTVKAKIKNESGYLESLIEKYLLDNTHRTTLTLKPDTSLAKRQTEADKEKLDEIRKAAGKDDIEKIMSDAAELKKIQETPDSGEALATIPVLKLSDINRKNSIIPITRSESGGTEIMYHDLFTNEIFYLDMGFDIHSLDRKYLPYVPLFGQALLEMGTETEDYVQFSQRISSKTGGIRRACFTTMIRNTDRGAAWMFLRCKAMPGQIDDLLKILSDMLLRIKLDNRERFRQIALQMKAGREQSIVPQGNKIVSLRLRSGFNEADLAAEQMHGVSSLFFLRALTERIDSDWPGVLADLEAVKSAVINRRSLIVNATLDAKNWTAHEPKLKAFLDEIPGETAERPAWAPEKAGEPEGLIIPSKVNFVGKGLNLYECGYKYHGSAHVIGRYLRTTWLWERVRMQGGAYGAACGFDEMSGIFTLVSYRDPNLAQTLRVYDDTARHLGSVNLTLDEIVKCIIGAIGDVDSYMLPDAKGYTSMLRVLNGNTDEVRQARRDEILSTNESHFRDFADILGHLNSKGLITVLGGEEALEEARRGDYHMLKLLKIM